VGRLRTLGAARLRDARDPLERHGWEQTRDRGRLGAGGVTNGIMIGE